MLLEQRQKTEVILISKCTILFSIPYLSPNTWKQIHKLLNHFPSKAKSWMKQVTPLIFTSYSLSFLICTPVPLNKYPNFSDLSLETWQAIVTFQIVKKMSSSNRTLCRQNTLVLWAQVEHFRSSVTCLVWLLGWRCYMRCHDLFSASTGLGLCQKHWKEPCLLLRKSLT